MMEPEDEALRNSQSIDHENFIKLEKQFDKTASFFLTNLNSIQRHITDKVMFNKFSNIDAKQKESFTSGFGYRLAQQNFATYPALCVSRGLDDLGASKLMVSFGAALTDTIFSVPFEMLSLKKDIEKDQGKKMSKSQACRASTRAFFPFLLRNNIAWIGMTLKSPWIEESLQDAGVKPEHSNVLGKFLQGAAAGALTVPSHNVGTLAMQQYDKSISHGWEVIKKEIKSNPLSFCKGAPTRSLAIGTSAVMFSGEMRDLVGEIIQEFAQDMKKMPSKSIKVLTSNTLSDMDECMRDFM